MIGPATYRLQWRRTMAKRYRLVAVSLALTFTLAYVLPSGVSTEQTPLVTGHSSFYNGDEFDPCLASIVGIMRLRVMWFNHEILVERYNGDGAYIYATEYGAPDPRLYNAPNNVQPNPRSQLVSSGVFYDFVDPNGVQWHVEEAYYDEFFAVDSKDPNQPLVKIMDPKEGPIWVNAEVKSKRWYTWIVAVGKPVRDNYAGSDPHEFYNFVTIINTCKFRKDNLPNSTTAGDTVVNHTFNLGPSNGHLKNDTAHTHEKYTVALWVGTQPVLLPVGTETPYRVAGEAGVDLDMDSDPTRDEKEYNHDE